MRLLQQRAAADEGEHGRGQQHVIEHHRTAAQRPQIVAGVLLDRQEQAGRARWSS